MSSDKEEWKVVPPRGRKGRQRLADILSREAVNEQNQAGNHPATSFLGLASMIADHEKLCSRWRDSASYKSLRAVISDNAAGHAPITKAICLGIGSFDVKDQSSRYCRSSHDAHVQFEAFRTVVEILEGKSGHKIKCYVQEPSFGPNDKDYCRTLGVEVVDTPDAFQYVDSGSLVFGIHLPHVAWGYALRDRLPGLYIGTDLKSLDKLNTTLRDDKELPEVIRRVEEMGSVADRYVFPTEERHSLLESTFFSTEILWLRKQAAASPEGEKD